MRERSPIALPLVYKDAFSRLKIPETENRPHFPVGIYEETDPLKTAAVWGTVGTEAVLAQLYPPDQSLFFDRMDVPQARVESSEFVTRLEGHGVNVIQVRDQLARLLPPLAVPREEMIHRLHQRAGDIQQMFGRTDAKDARAIDETLEFLFDLDIERYGLEAAAAINQRVTLSPEIPMGNLMFARDQMNVILDTMVISNMRKPIRRPEVDLYRMVYKEMLGEDEQGEIRHATQIPEHETFEGGDAYIHNGVIYVGVGPRTSLGGAVNIYNAIKPRLNELGMGFAIVEDRDTDHRPLRDQMDFMHIDTFSGPTGKSTVVLTEQEAERRQVSVLTSSSEGQVRIHDTGRSFAEYLEMQGDRILAIPAEEQQSFGCNFLMVDDTTALVPLECNGMINKELEASGKTVEQANLNEITRGYGAAHCITGQLQRIPRS